RLVPKFHEGWRRCHRRRQPRKRRKQQRECQECDIGQHGAEAIRRLEPGATIRSDTDEDACLATALLIAFSSFFGPVSEVQGTRRSEMRNGASSRKRRRDELRTADPTFRATGFEPTVFRCQRNSGG